MRVFVFLVLMVFVTSCGPPHSENNPPSSNKQSLANEVRNTAFAHLLREKDLYPFGTAGQMMDQIQMLGLAFHYYKEVDLDEARELLLYAGNVFLNIINSNEQIRSYLDHYPFKPENIQVKIFLKKPDGSECSVEKLCVITMIDGALKYKIDQPETYKLLTVYNETYDEAVSKLATVIAPTQSE